MGGIGKTVLAAALARNSEVRRAFLDGIYWLTVGQTPSLLSLQGQVKFQQRYQMRNRILSKVVPALEFCSFCSSQNCVLFEKLAAELNQRNLKNHTVRSMKL